MSEILHKIKAKLYQNLLTEDPNDYTARVISERTLNIEEICKDAVARGGAASTAAAMEHNVNLFLKEMMFKLMDGYSINTNYFTATPHIKGVFNSPLETFNPDKHSILIRLNQGERARTELSKIKVDILGVGDNVILVSHVVDIKTGVVNDIITPGGILKIKGAKLKIVGNNPEVGVYFQDESENTIKVEEGSIAINKPSELIVQIPQLEAGVYKLIIKNQYTVGSALLNEPRTSIFEKNLTVL